jgi:gluconate 5-dehydrogenase
MISNLFSIEGKNILITGSSRGIGFKLAHSMGKLGANIILNGTNEIALAVASDKMRSDNINALSFLFDVSDEQETEAAINNIIDDWGRIDVLINNAGIQIRSPIEDFSTSEWDKIMNINLRAAFIVSKIVGIKSMIPNKSGKIINICSLQSELGRPSITPYAVSKGGIKMLTKGMATEWGKYNIQTNGLGPGYFVTDMTEALVKDEKFNSWVCSRVPANRWGETSELVGAAVFLSSKASDYVNGHILYVDGGMLACV